MKQSNSRVLIMISALIILSAACAALTGGGEPAQNPTIPPIPTVASLPTSAPLDVPTKELPPATEQTSITGQEFFTEEFEDGGFFNEWYYFLQGSGAEEEEKLLVEQQDDGLLVDLGALNMYFYFIYDLQTYDDVKVTMIAENLGRNNNNVSLICRLDFDNSKWYEFSVESGGVWYLYAYDSGYRRLDSGGTNALKQGKEINEYQLECDRDSITMTINGEKLKTYEDRVYSFREGQVGFNISSLNVLPITVSVKSFDIAQP